MLFTMDLILFGLFIIILAILILRDREKVKREGIILIRRTKKGRNFIDRVAKKGPRFWNVFAIIGIIVAIPALIFVSIFLVNNAYWIMSGGAAENGVRLLLPGPVSAPILGPGVFIVPWWIWVIGVLCVMIPHEFSHGIMCRLEKIRIRSVGWLLLFVIPGAFVEPDEEQLKKSKKSTKLKVYAAGSFANILVAFIILIAFTAMFPLLFTPAGVYFQTVENTPANLTGMTGSIIEMGNQRVVSPDNISEILAKYKPGDTIEVKTAYNNHVVPHIQLSFNSVTELISSKAVIVTDFDKIDVYTVTLTEHPEKEGNAYLGIISMDGSSYSSGLDPQLYRLIAMVFMFIFIFNLGIGLVNLLPIKPLDGGLIFEVITEKFSNSSSAIVKTVSGIMLAFLLFNLIGPLFM